MSLMFDMFVLMNKFNFQVLNLFNICLIKELKIKKKFEKRIYEKT